ncbi:NUDIX domain-containing protein [Mesoterricola sediminis]|uniref:GDP-mannose pyrophosphatase n=1 Tax=Mesoterricola sediminis TaxID=2927980 RepID=A0AA48GZ29_9BACT|nr:NUDIX hydrolase [Mesoterricola sediminis]BDU76667.1 ADP-ribose pyrophosphatase [Mesoterricola sediminis]
MHLPPLPVPARPNPFTRESSRPVFDSPWVRLRVDHVRHRSGGESQYGVVGFRRTACGVLALDDEDRVVLVGQWRYPLERYSWEIVEGGGLEEETPFEAIRRELREEAGLEAAQWEPLAFLHTSNACTDEEAFLFLATGLSAAPGGTDFDDTEELACVREPFAACAARILHGEISDSLTVTAILALQARRAGVSAALDPALAERFFQRPDRDPAPGRARWSNLERP